jgi:hypothetical protein
MHGSNEEEPMHNDDRLYLRLLDEIEAQGGSLLPGTCKATHLPDLSKSTEPGKKPDPVYTHGCGRERRVEIPDRLLADEKGKAPVTIACAEGDMVHLWPRFEHIKEDE